MRWIKTEADTLAPFDDAARTFMRNVAGEPVGLRPVTEHESLMLAFVFSALRQLAQAMQIDPEDLRAELLLDTGRFRVRRLLGQTVLMVNSMSTRAMSEAQLRTFWHEALPHLRKKLVMRVGAEQREQLEQALLQEEATA